MNLSYKHVASPVGRLKLVASDAGLAAVLWGNDNPQRVRLAEMAEETEHHRAPSHGKRVEGILLRCEDWLQRAFGPSRDRLSEAGLDCVARYSVRRNSHVRQLAAHLGRPTATRAVGAANGRNPIGIVVPLPQSDRFIGQAHRLCGRTGRES